jgi:hypothetical protein
MHPAEVDPEEDPEVAVMVLMDGSDPLVVAEVYYIDTAILIYCYLHSIHTYVCMCVCMYVYVYMQVHHIILAPSLH